MTVLRLKRWGERKSGGTGRRKKEKTKINLHFSKWFGSLKEDYDELETRGVSIRSAI